MEPDDPTPWCTDTGGCHAGVRWGAGRWRVCGAVPVCGGPWEFKFPEPDTVMIWVCEEHAPLLPQVRPISEEEAGELRQRREEEQRILDRAQETAAIGSCRRSQTGWPAKSGCLPLDQHCLRADVPGAAAG
jgi:hypothetical protein